MTTRALFTGEPSVKQAFTERHRMAFLSPRTFIFHAATSAAAQPELWRALIVPRIDKFGSGALLIFRPRREGALPEFGTSVGGQGWG